MPVSRSFTAVSLACALASVGAVARAQESDPLTRFDVLNERGWAIPHPSVADTLVGDAAGVRSAMAAAGVGFYGLLLPNLYETDLSGSNKGKPRAVNGQVGTWNYAIQSLTVTYDLGKVGLDGGQLIFSGVSNLNGLQLVNGPDVARIRSIAYNQLLGDGKIQIQFGTYPNDVHFVGSTVGGNIAAGALGPQAFIPIEVGLSYSGFATPAAEGRFEFGHGFYDRIGVQRSLAPGGGNVEAKVNPGLGLKFAPAGTGTLIINELGYQQAASDSQQAVWVRLGGIYNWTQYRTFTTGQGVANWAYYALVDHQVTSVPGAPYRGAYVGASAMYAPPEQNLFSQYYELRAYYVGPFDGRPGDFASFVGSYETYSQEGKAVLAPPGLGSSATATVIGSYAFRVRPGLYVQPGLGITTDPNISRAYHSSFDFYLGIGALL